MSVLAIIPARSGSKGIPNKNFRLITGTDTPTTLACRCALAAGCAPIACSTDSRKHWPSVVRAPFRPPFLVIERPPELAQDDTPMIAVVQHALEQIPGPPDQQIVLLQPTQPLREPKHITQALELLTPEVDSVVSVTRVPAVYHQRWQCDISTDGWLIADVPWPARRQDLPRTFVRDGTVYAFWRRTVARQGDIYGHLKKALLIPAAETCPLDTPEDWAEAERRLKERER